MKKKTLMNIFSWFLLICNILMLVYALIIETNVVHNYFINGSLFSDFITPMQKKRENAYVYPHFSNYPALANLFFLVLKRAGDAMNISDMSQWGTDVSYMVFFLITVIVSLYFFVAFSKRYLREEFGDKVDIFIISIITSGPFLYLYIRGNILIVVLFLLLYYVLNYNSEYKKNRYIAFLCLSIAVALKIYVVFFGLLTLKRKNNKETILLIILGSIIFFLPFVVFGENSVFDFLNNFFVRSGEGYFYYNHAVSMAAIFQFIAAFILGAGLSINEIWYALLTVVVGVVILLISKEEWMDVYAVSLMSILMFKASYIYNVVILVIPLLIFFRNNIKRKVDSIIVLLNIGIFAILFLPRCYMIENALGYEVVTNVSWSMVVCDMCLLMLYCVIFLVSIHSKILIKKEDKHYGKK